MAEYTCPQCEGDSDATWAEARWRDVDGELCCSAYCAAIQDGASEDEAQQARAEHTESVAGELRAQRIKEARELLEAEGEL